jgi:hypothetical protein
LDWQLGIATFSPYSPPTPPEFLLLSQGAFIPQRIGVLAEMGKKVLLVDMDQQGSLSSSFLSDKGHRIINTILKSNRQPLPFVGLFSVHPEMR